MRVFLDNNMWDYFADNKVDINEFLPENEYELAITTHGKYEILQIPEHRMHVKEYALKALDNRVKIDAVFGFYSDLFPVEYQRSSGFSKGRLSSDSEGEVRASLIKKYGSTEKRKKSQILFKEEADIELAVREKFHAVVTFDANKNGPLLDALNNGWKVISLNLKDSRESSVRLFMANLVERLDYKKT
ncbi:hypothetical protein [Oceanisphaera ostreae]|uniref:PIN domain-containing protein n=1 Tax=Oceanisphaera ostreae TaxID=914151 RepID=A0ABW3KEV1_9GAMM